MRPNSKQSRLNAQRPTRATPPPRDKSVNAGPVSPFIRASRQGLKFTTAACFSIALITSLASCAGGPSPGASLENSIANSNTPPTTTAGTQAVAIKDFDCGRLIGRMQVRILQIRDYSPATKTSGLSRGIQGLTTGLFGGSSRGLNPDNQYQRDVAQLTAQNESLAAHRCKTFDLDKELRPSSINHTPTPR